MRTYAPDPGKKDWGTKWNSLIKIWEKIVEEFFTGKNTVTQLYRTRKDKNMIKYLLLISLFMFSKVSMGQEKIYFKNETGRPVWVQKTNILGVGSFPYVIDTVSGIQSIPIDGGTPTILNVVIVPLKGPYGTADGIDYLFKPDDTLIVKSISSTRSVISHISSAERTKELSFIHTLLNFARVNPYYTLKN